MTGDGQNLGNATGYITIDASGVSAGINQARQALQSGFGSMGDAFKGVAGHLSNLGTLIAGLSAPLIGFGATGLRVAAEFDSAISEISARTGLVGEELEKVRQIALQMGADTVFSARESADAFLELLASGQSAAEAIETLPAVLDAAAASGESLGHTADVVTDIMAAFNLQVDQSRMVVDALARAAGASSADMSSLGQGFGNIGPVARQFGLDVNETAAILAIFAENGIKGAEAGTQLRSMLLNMTRDTEDVNAAWEALGTSFFDAQGNARDLSDVIRDINRGLRNKSQREQIEIMKSLGGAYGVVGLEALRSTISIEGMQQRMAQQASAAEIAEKRMKTFEQRVRSLRGSLEAFQIQTLTPFMNERLGPLVEQVTQIVNGFTEWAKQNQKTVNTVIEMALRAAGLGASIFALGKVLTVIVTLVTSLAGVLSFMLSPIGLVIAAVIALARAYTTNFGGIRDLIDNEIFPRLLVFFNWLAAVWQNTVRPGLERLRAWFVEDALPVIIEFIKTQALPALDRFFAFLGRVWQTIQPSLALLFNWFVRDALPAIVAVLRDMVIPAVARLIDFVGQVWTNVQPGLTRFANWFLKDALPVILNYISTTVIPIVGQLISQMLDIWRVVSPGLLQFTKLLGVLIETFVRWAEANPKAAATLVQIVTGLTALRFGISAVASLIPGLGPMLTVFTSVSRTISSLTNTFQTLNSLMNFHAIAARISAAAQWLLNIAMSANPIMLLVIALGVLIGILVKFGPQLLEIAQHFLNTNAIAQQFGRGLERVFNFAKTAINLFVREVTRFFTQTIPNALDGLLGAFDTVFGWIGDIINGVLDIILAIPNAVADAIEALKGLDRTGEGRGGLFGSGFGPDFDPIGGIRGFFASGGRPPVGQVSVVGEAGPELFVADRPGSIISNETIQAMLTGGGGVSIGSFAPSLVLPDIGGYQPEQIKELFRESLYDFLKQVNAR